MLLLQKGKIVNIDTTEDDYRNITAVKPMNQLRDEGDDYAVKPVKYQMICYSIFGTKQYNFMVVECPYEDSSSYGHYYHPFNTVGEGVLYMIKDGFTVYINGEKFIHSEVKTMLGNDVLLETRAILYLCNYRGTALDVINEAQFRSQSAALQAYASIPNPESQLVSGKDYDDLIKNLVELHNNMQDDKWLAELGEVL